MRLFAKIRADVFAEQRAQLRRGLSPIETSQGDTGGQTFAVPINQRLRAPVGAIEFGIAIGADDERSFLAQRCPRSQSVPLFADCRSSA